MVQESYGKRHDPRFTDYLRHERKHPPRRSAEAIVGVDSLRSMIQDAVAGQTSAIVTALSGFGGGGDITIPVYLGGTLLDETIVTAQQRMALRSGGR